MRLSGSGRVDAVVFSTDDRQIISGSNDGTLHLWDASSKSARVVESYGHSAAIMTATFSRDGCQVVYGSYSDPMQRLWDIATGVHREFEGHRRSVKALAICPDGRHIVSGSEDRTLRLCEVSNCTSRVLEGHNGWVNDVAFSRYAVSGSEDHTLRLWEVSSRASRVMNGHEGAVWAVAFFARWLLRRLSLK